MAIRKAIYILSFSIGIIFSQVSFAWAIHFTPGPYGGSKIITPWGNYMAIPSGNSVWIGTVDEYMDAKVRAIAWEQNLKIVKTEGTPENAIELVDLKYPHASLDKVDIYQINSAILFGVGSSKELRRPKKPENYEYVSIAWNQTNHTNVELNIINLAKNKAIKPFSCEKIEGIRLCEFIVDRLDLIEPASYIFFAKKSKPSAIQVTSIAKRQYEDTKIKYIDMKGPISSEDEIDLQALHALDSSIPITIN